MSGPITPNSCMDVPLNLPCKWELLYRPQVHVAAPQPAASQLSRHGTVASLISTLIEVKRGHTRT